MTTPRMRRALPATLLAALLTPGLAACGDDANSNARTGATTTEADPTTAAEEAAALTVTDPWVKATDETMTAAFGTLVNDSGTDVTVVGAEVTGAGMVELHETVQNDDGSMAMQAKEGGFVVPAGGELALEPGGNHIMLMELDGAYEAGTTLTLTLELADGSTADVEATVKPFDGADENYQGGGSETDSEMDSEMDMGGDS